MSAADRADAGMLWDYHQLDHRLRPCPAAIVLGCRDLGVAAFAARLYHAGLFPVVVFSGASSPTTAARFPRGEATHFSAHARALGVPASAILMETEATNTGENITCSRRVLEQAGLRPSRLLLICMPGMQRRAFATCRKAWPQTEPICVSEPVTFDEYASRIGGARLLTDILTGDLQRIIDYPALGYAIPQPVPAHVVSGCQRLLAAGYDRRLPARLETGSGRFSPAEPATPHVTENQASASSEVRPGP